MSIKTVINSDIVAKRMELMKSGFKKYTSIRKIPMDAETKWSLDLVALTSDFTPPPEFMRDSNLNVTQKGIYYSISKILEFCTKLNDSKADWIEVMKS